MSLRRNRGGRFDSALTIYASASLWIRALNCECFSVYKILPIEESSLHMLNRLFWSCALKVMLLVCFKEKPKARKEWADTPHCQIIYSPWHCAHLGRVLRRNDAIFRLFCPSRDRAEWHICQTLTIFLWQLPEAVNLLLLCLFFLFFFFSQWLNQTAALISNPGFLKSTFHVRQALKFRHSGDDDANHHKVLQED